jgi:hypothetical protein
MPLRYAVDDEHRIVITTGYAVLTDQELFEYKQSVWSRPEVAGYDELLDAREVEKVDIPSAERLRELARLSAAMDVNVPSKVAIVASDPVTFGIARIYEILRELDPRSTREVSVFRAVEEALVWLKHSEKKPPARRRKAATS